MRLHIGGGGRTVTLHGRRTNTRSFGAGRSRRGLRAYLATRPETSGGGGFALPLVTDVLRALRR